MEYADACSEGSYHPPKVAEENAVSLPVPEPSLPTADQLCPPSDQHQERSQSLPSASFFSMISPAKFGHLGAFYFCEVGTGLLKVAKSARKPWEVSEAVRSAPLK